MLDESDVFKKASTELKELLNLVVVGLNCDKTLFADI